MVCFHIGPQIAAIGNARRAETHSQRRACLVRSTRCATTWIVVKKLLFWLAVAFVVYYLVTEPVVAADAVKGAVATVGDGFESLVSFLTRLFS